jgi:HSP20 family protein
VLFYQYSVSVINYAYRVVVQGVWGGVCEMVEMALKKDETPRVNKSASEDPQILASDGTRWRFITRPLVWRPPTDVYETDEVVVIRVEIAGMREEDFSISLEDRFVVVRGIRPDTSERRAYHQMEIPFGEFSTEIELLCAVSPKGIEALYQDGFLRIVFQKESPYQVKVEG